MKLEAIVLCAALLAAGPAAAQELKVVINPTEPDEVPPGVREDQLLWKSARDATVEGMGNILAANSELAELRAALAHVDVLEKDASAGDRAALAAIRARLEDRRAALAAAIPTGPTGGCRYTLIHLEQSMDAEPGTALANRLPQKREEARWCAETFSAANAKLAPAIASTRAALDEVVPELRKRGAARPAPAAVAKPGETPAAPVPASAPASAATSAAAR
ncbi:hypothetical protein [Anaeromyxobacter oryzae]|uniref:DUF5667 domain-containing protein n=1 Tax=Anaeromyxobacter oryzae TaxID=2918170 RepID=A0ABM7WNH2_9BACT|nr:hypothetical protein [Anaeromyxobacter oryzae]BDG01021.1 hypothetical protein AMOR_00170 [Anaeromyxobacter oryzae]